MEDQDEKFPKEKRRAPRVSGTLVEYTFEGKDAPAKEAFIKDICIYGVCIFVPHNVEQDEILCLNVYLSGDDNPINAKGKVIWHKAGSHLGYFNVGIEFTKMSVEHKVILTEYIEKNYQGANGADNARGDK